MIPALKNLQKSYVAALFAGIILSIFIYVWIFGVNILYLDEWSFVPLVKEAQTHGISFDMLFKQHNEHRVFFPRLFYLAMLPVSQMNSKLFMFMNMIMLFIVFSCFYLIAKKQFSFSLSKIPVWIIIIPLFVFNFRQSQNLLWAFQIAFYMVLTFAVLSLFFVEKAYSVSIPYLKPVYLFLAVLFAIIATYSSAMGAMVWIAGGVLLQIKNNYKNGKQIQPWLIILSWIIIGSIAVYFYYSGLQSTIKQNLFYLLAHPFKFIHFFFSLISLTSVHSLSIIAFPIGIFIFSISIFVLFKTYSNKRLKENGFWVAIYVFSMMFLIITTIGRSPIAFEYTDRARYTIFSSLFILSAFMMFYDNYRVSTIRYEKKTFQFFFVFLILLALELNAIGIAFGIKEKREKKHFTEVVLNYKNKPVSIGIKNMYKWCTDTVFLNMVDKSVPYIEKNHYNIFAETK